MREKPLLAIAPAPIVGLPEFYAVAFHQAQLAAQRYNAMTTRADQGAKPLRAISDILVSRENARADTISIACIDACGQPPDPKNLPANLIDLVPMQEIADIAESRLSTPYMVWALAVRHRERAFVFWTYIAALTKHLGVRAAAESLAREALVDANLLRRERRLAWQHEHGLTTENDSGDRSASAPLLESLLRRDIIAWSQMLPPAEGRQLLKVGAMGLAPHSADPSEPIETPTLDEIEQIKQRALRRAEQLSNVYLDEADRAKDQGSLEFAQELATYSIARLAGLRTAASSPKRPML